MYRPNRIGPWPLIHVDKLPIDFGTPANYGNELTFDPHVADTTIRSTTASRMISAYTNATTFTSRASFSIGVAIDGSNPIGAPNGDDQQGFYVSVSGHCVVRDGDDGQLEACIGRCDASTLTIYSSGSNPCADFFRLPIQGMVAQDEWLSASINTTLLIGHYDGSDTYESDPLIFGWRLVNQSAGAKQYRMMASMTIHKYAQDIHAFDPNRA